MQRITPVAGVRRGFWLAREFAVVCALVAIGCAPPSRGLRLDVRSPPGAVGAVAAVVDGVAHAETTLTARDGTTLYVQQWRPATAAPRAVVVVHHGLADHSARYRELAHRLVRAGYVVWAHDMRGHARSSGRRVTLDRIDQLVEDLDAVVQLARSREPGRPVFLFGHSVGGLTTALYAIERRPDVAGVVLSAPAIAFDAPAFGIGAIRFIAALAPNAPILKTPHADFSSSADVIAAMRRDPLIEAGAGPARTARAATDGVRRVWAAADRLAAPLLAVHGTADKLVAPIGSRELVARGGSARTLRLYDGLQHDLLHEPDGAGDRVAADILAWFDAQLAGGPAPWPSSPARRMRGDRRSMALAIELDLRGERRDDDVPDASLTGGLRVRVGIGRIGYAGGIDVRGGYREGALLVADLHAAGVALRSATGATFAVTGGIGVRRADGGTTPYAPIEAALELPLGALHVLARTSVVYRLRGDDGAADALGIADEARALLGVRLGRDHRYWPGTVAGAGPFVGATYEQIGDVASVGVVLGGQLWGGN